MQRQIGRAARRRAQQLALDRRFHHILGHLAIGGPLAAGDRDQARLRHQNRMFARQRRGGRLASRLDQRPQPGPDAGHVGARGVAGQVACRRLQDEIDVVGARAGLQRQVVARRVGGADDGVAVPGHDEQHPAVIGLRNQDRPVAGQEAARDGQVHALARRHHGPRLPVLHLPHRIDPHPRGIDHAVRAQREGLAAFAFAGEGILRGHAGDHAVFLREPGRAHVVDRRAAHVEQRAHQRHGQPCIVELAVEVEVAAAQRPSADVFGQRGRGLQRLPMVQPAAAGQVQAARQHVVHLEADAVERLVEHLVGRHHEAQRPDQVRRVAGQQATLVQRLAYQADVALGQVAHAAVHELGGLA
ncbi:hypothetical protein D3C87_1227920 [compost metagenome]